MEKSLISELFEDGGLIISQTSNQKIQKLLYQEVVHLFEKKGIILFQDFDIKTKELKDITDQYTEIYAEDALRRSARYGENVIRNVDSGENEVLLHSEASFAPAWPELI